MKRELPIESIPGDSHVADYETHKVDVYKLIHAAESIPEENQATMEFEKSAHKNTWKDGNGSPLSPKDILSELTYTGEAPNWEALAQNHPEWQDEIEKIKNADYEAYPIIVIGSNMVIDGMHRLARALAEKVENIQIKRFHELPRETIVTEQTLDPGSSPGRQKK